MAEITYRTQAEIEKIIREENDAFNRKIVLESSWLCAMFQDVSKNGKKNILVSVMKENKEKLKKESFCGQSDKERKESH